MAVAITKHKELPSDNGGEYRKYRLSGLIDGEKFFVEIEDGQILDYDGPDLSTDEEKDEALQIAVGEYLEANDIDPGKCHR